jgi:hypothetical protein
LAATCNFLQVLSEAAERVHFQQLTPLMLEVLQEEKKKEEEFFYFFLTVFFFLFSFLVRYRLSVQL